MSSERDNCGLSSLFPMSCRDRAEAFARRLHSRLSSLGSQSGSDISDETSWLGTHENLISLSQPRHSSDPEKYLDIGLLDLPSSPQEEIVDTELEKLINKNNLKHSQSEECHSPKSRESLKTHLFTNLTRHASNDSDNEVFYDTENYITEKKIANGNTNLELSKSTENKKGIDVSSQDTSFSYQENFPTSSNCTSQSTLREDVFTLSLKDDEEYSSLELNDCLGKNYEDCNGATKVLEKNNCTECNGKSKEVKTVVSSLSIKNDLNLICPTEKIKNIDLNIQVSEDEEDYEERIPRVRRCSSLKTGKTPPGTPGRKKIVRFADVLGLDLADVRTFLDEIPKIPTSAYEDLNDVDINGSSSDNSENNKFHGIKTEKILVLLFQQPGSLPKFLDLVRDNQVCLENVLIEDPILFTIKGIIRVRNCDFHKSVFVRYTLDGWKTFADVQGKYVENSCDGFSDKFTFIIYAHTLSVGQRLELACRFQCKGCQFWDNNNGANYVFQCMAASNNTSFSTTTGMNADWAASFY